jgi:hypothetical protein
MARTNVELYEALKPIVGTDGARMIAEVVPPAADLVTKADLLATKADLLATTADLVAEVGSVHSEIATLRGEMREGFAQLRGEIHAESTRTTKWMLGFFIPVWAGTWATVVAVVVKLS